MLIRNLFPACQLTSLQKIHEKNGVLGQDFVITIVVAVNIFFLRDIDGLESMIGSYI